MSPQYSVWFDRGTAAMVRDHMKKYKHSFSRSTCILVGNCIRHGWEGIHMMEKSIARYREQIRELHEKIAELKIQQAEVKEIEQ